MCNVCTSDAGLFTVIFQKMAGIGGGTQPLGEHRISPECVGAGGRGYWGNTSRGRIGGDVVLCQHLCLLQSWLCACAVMFSVDFCSNYWFCFVEDVSEVIPTNSDVLRDPSSMSNV